MAITHLPAGVNAEHVSAVRDTTLHNTIKLSWDASNMRSEEGVDSLFAGGNPQDNVIQRIKNTIIADNGAKASQDSKLPLKNIMLLQFPENVKSLAAPWQCSCVEGLSNVAVGTTFPGLHFMDGHLITNWEKEDWDAGTINKGGKFSPHPAEFRPATGLGSAGVGTGFGGGVGHSGGNGFGGGVGQHGVGNGFGNGFGGGGNGFGSGGGYNGGGNGFGGGGGYNGGGNGFGGGGGHTGGGGW